MQKLQELKQEAYEIAMAQYSDGGFRHYDDMRIDAMKTYALLTIAENLNKDNLEE